MVDLLKRLRTSKMAHGWLNTGHQREKMYSEASSTCPRCHEANETQEHILRCQDPRANATRYRAIVTLQSTVVTKSGSSKTWDVLVKCLQTWLRQDNEIKIGYLNLPYPAGFCSALDKAIVSQNLIGWKYAFRGYLSNRWIDAYASEFPKVPPHQIRQRWGRQVIRSIWVFGETMWLDRNKALHKNESKDIAESAIDARICHLYLSQEEFAAGDRVLFNLPLEARLHTSLNSRKHWLVLIQRYKETTEGRRRGHQDLITKFFTRAIATTSPTQGIT